MQITATELKLNMGKYLSMAGRRDIYITKNGRRIAKLTNPSPDRVAMLDSLVGIARTEDIALDDIKRERLEKLLQLVGFADALGEDVHAAIASNMADFEDALVTAIAERCHMDYIVTRNTRDYVKSSVKALTPQEFLEL